MDREQIWLAVSFAWSEIGLERSDYARFATRIGATPADATVLRRVVFWEVAGAFAVDTVLAAVSMGVTLPDWGYEDEYVLRKVRRWRARPLVWSLCNPVWLLGYPVACLVAVGAWRELKRAVDAENGVSAA